MLNSGDQMIGEYSSTGAVLRRYVHGPGIDEPLVRYEGSGTTDRHYLHADERGSVIAISDGSGNVTDVNAYDEYGIPASGNTGRFQYTGQQWLSELGMQYSRARIYSPSLGRFMQTDPIGFEGGMNIYAYVSNDPVNFIDPLGLQDTILVTGHRPEGGINGPVPELAGQLGLRAAAAMMAGPTVSEYPSILVTGERLPRRPGPLATPAILLHPALPYGGLSPARCADVNCDVVEVRGPSRAHRRIAANYADRQVAEDRLLILAFGVFVVPEVGLAERASILGRRIAKFGLGTLAVGTDDAQARFWNATWEAYFRQAVIILENGGTFDPA